MIAMQYSFTLPADYDMSIIERRVQEKGPAFDGLPGLEFKAFMVARKDDPACPSAENLYAPLYLWRDTRGMEEFLSSSWFRAATEAFGWPAVRTWIPAAITTNAELSAARFVSRELTQLVPYTNLDEFRRREALAIKEGLEDGLVWGLSGFEPVTWTHVRFRLWSQPPRVAPHTHAQIYRVLHLSPGD
jgi:hypothetical protein